MKILVIGGTRYFGRYTVEKLVRDGHDVTIASRGNASDDFGDTVKRVRLDRTDPDSVRKAIGGQYFDVIVDKVAYGSNDIPPVLDNVSCRRYVHMSTTSVYPVKTMDTREGDFRPEEGKLKWCSRGDYDYGETKRQAEIVLTKNYPDIDKVFVRYPFVIGEDDYSKRTEFYLKHIKEEIPMYIDNMDEQIGYIRSDEAGEFIAFLAEDDGFTGPVNGASHGTMSIRELVTYVENRTGKKAVLSPDGDPAPYNGETSYSINTELAESLGFRFADLDKYIYDLLDHFIDE